MNATLFSGGQKGKAYGILSGINSNSNDTILGASASAGAYFKLPLGF